MALSADRLTLSQEGGVRSFPVAAGKVIYAGALVVLNAAGFAQPGAAGTGLVAVGRAEGQFDNSQGADGAITAKVRSGTFAYQSATGADQIGGANINATCYVVDDQTVALTNGGNTRSPAGTVFQVDADGVWVRI